MRIEREPRKRPVFEAVQPRLKELIEQWGDIIYWSNEDDAFVAEVPELLGCSAHGDTKASALRSVEQAIDLWIDTAREFGDPSPTPGVSA